MWGVAGLARRGPMHRCSKPCSLLTRRRGWQHRRRHGKRIGYLTPLLYQGGVGSAGCADIASGDNVTATVGGYSAGPGYYAVSGWGTPNGKQLLAALPA
jgi:hypothetical protein